VSPRRSSVAILVALLLFSQLALALPQSQSKPRRNSRATQRKNKPPVIPTAEPQAPRGLSVQQIRSGVSLDGRGKLWAVVVGVSNYKNLSADAQLKFAHRDAEAFAAFLRSPQGGGFPSSQIKVLLNQEATLAAVRTALGTWLARSAEPDDVVYVFFAGHGVVEGDRDGYLLAYDSDPQNLYATALSVDELNKAISERLKARLAVLFTDACHAGRLGFASRGVEDKVLINRFLDEVGKTGQGVFRLLASRPDELSYEDKRWGGGHGVFTNFLLEGLHGRADRDADGVVRAGELLDYLSEIVPNETKALQHPRAAGNIETRLPLAVISTAKANPASNVAIESQPAALEVRGVPGTEVYCNNAYRGRIRPNGLLVIEGLTAGPQELSFDPPGAETFAQTVSLAGARTVLDLRAALPASAGKPSSPLIAQIRQELSHANVLENGGAWDIYKRMIADAPTEPQRQSVEIALSTVLEEIGQQAINEYVRSPEEISTLRRDLFPRSARAFNCLLKLRPQDQVVEAKKLFCDGRVLIDGGKTKEAIPVLQRATALDPKAAYAFNALGVAYRQEKENSKATEAFMRATQLAPSWALPRFQLGAQYYTQKEFERAATEFKAAVGLAPKDSISRLMLARAYRERGDYAQAEREAQALLQANSNYAPAYVEMGLIHEAGRAYDKAVAAFESYLRLVPNDPDRAAVEQRIKQNRKLAAKQK
ncbi:MAG TPA: caspase family protein, partial [Blastocatellia bacterium]|nr:caspase family protein [Blastocatellia bacterium]